MSNKDTQLSYHEDELSLRQILIFLYSGKLFFGIFLFFTALVSYYYVNTISPTYKTQIEFHAPGDVIVSRLKKAFFNDDSLIKIDRNLFSSQYVFEAFDKKVNSHSFRKSVFDQYNYSERLGLNSDDLDSIYSFIDRVKKNTKNSKKLSTLLYMQGPKPKILSDFLNDLVSSAHSSLISDFEEIELNYVTTKIDEIKMKQNREIDFLNKFHLNEIKALNSQLFLAKSLEDKDTDLEKVSLVFHNESLLKTPMMSSSSRSMVFPLWYLYGQKFIENEIQRSSAITDFRTEEYIQLDSALKSLESFKIDLKDIDLVDISWSLTPNDPISPKKRLTMIIVLFIAFLLSIFLWYVIVLFKPSK